MTDRITVVVVDDEALARRGIITRLAHHPAFHVVAEAADATSGVQAIRAHHPAVAFLDIEMPGADGFAMLRALPAAARPLSVFVTAHDNRALDAFDVHAVAYLLKPIDDERFARTIALLRERLAGRAATGMDRVAVRDRGSVILLEPAAIDWVQSEGDYVRVHTGRRSYLHHATMKTFGAQLPAAMFVRIHRGALVNVDRVHTLTPLTNGDYTVQLTTGARLKLSRTHRDALARRLGRAL